MLHFRTSIISTLTPSLLLLMEIRADLFRDWKPELYRTF
jgi:hypothetical protein